MVKAGDEIMDEGMDEVGNEFMDDGWRNAIEIIVEEATDELQAKALANPQGRPLGEHDRLEVRFTEDADSGLLVESEKKKLPDLGVAIVRSIMCIFLAVFLPFLGPYPVLYGIPYAGSHPTTQQFGRSGPCFFVDPCKRTRDTLKRVSLIESRHPKQLPPQVTKFPRTPHSALSFSLDTTT